ncbi:MAG: acyltransferase family protein [Lachnospiraceae bacterium]|nr:acyltransferase family protein [Lachnospiraceae bacterium]
MKTKSRIAYYDNLKGILILLVVITHFAFPLSGEKEVRVMIDFVFLFHMPLFILLSGLFSKGGTPQERRAWGRNVVYYAIIYGMMIALILVVVRYWFPVNLLSPFHAWGGGIAWYMMAMVWFTLLTPLFKNTKPVPVMLVLLAIAVLSGFYPLGDLFTLSRTIVFLPFFALGVYLGSGRLLSFRQSHKRLSHVCKIFAVLITAVLCILLYKMPLSCNELIKMMSKGRSSYLEVITATGLDIGNAEALLFRLVLYVVTAGIIIVILTACPLKKIPVLNTAGKKSLRIYFYHAPLNYAAEYSGITQRIAQHFPEGWYLAFSILLGVVIVLIIMWLDFLDYPFKLAKWLAGKLVTKTAA